jgi:hypothetical protein
MENLSNIINNFFSPEYQDCIIKVRRKYLFQVEFYEEMLDLLEALESKLCEKKAMWRWLIMFYE